MIKFLKPGVVVAIMHYILNTLLLTVLMIMPLMTAFAASATASKEPQTTYPRLTYATTEPQYDFSEIAALIGDHAGTEENDLYTGASVLIAHQGKIFYQQAFGYAQVSELQSNGQLLRSENPIPVSSETIFDLASVTKVAATTVSLMHLVSEQQLFLDDTLDKFFAEFSGTDKAKISVRQLLTHRSGLWQWQPTWLYTTNNRTTVDYIAALPLRYSPGERRAYSDLGFILLGKIIEKVSGMPLNQFTERHIYNPLGMNNTGYRPVPAKGKQIAATSHGNPFEQNMVATGKPYPLAQPLPKEPFSAYRNYTLIGEANDGNAWYGLGGVAGHAGLFSTVGDLAILGQTLLNGCGYGNFRLCDADTLNTFLQTPYDNHQALGFWKDNNATGVSFWHPGFTGTQFLVQPEQQLVIVLLTNRQHGGLNRDNGRYPDLSPVWKKLVKLTSQLVSE
ncbi:serine hydrolase domain-containing protein [Lacimicrobium alkaliphilum]|uniref:UPF0214 protein YfeW n=1 Tax=Lacimicrobium alkaliphilum TaxID=1526571 RepID=A0ABQ1RLR9_9ALTE|nr:serine hydrolase [Lacimicrobium alkaliphilum]GGD71082.1 UPF0214 protein YfeW [Lacimicrobium alkaliphilum]